VAAAWARAGLGLAWRKTYFASTFRLDVWARYLPFDERTANPAPPDAPRRYRRLDEHSQAADVTFGSHPGEAADDPRPGDILLVGGVNTGYGKHVTLVESYDPVNGLFTTVEGNATGPGPRGGRQHGVIRTTRPVGLRRQDALTTYHARRLIRPSIHDLGPLG
jgi:hypothetical protein